MSTAADATRPDEWLIVKRGLYFRPDCRGYTGIRDNAGRFTHEFAKGYQDHDHSIVHVSEAPEFTAACYQDFAIEHMHKQRDEAVTRALAAESLATQHRHAAKHLQEQLDLEHADRVAAESRLQAVRAETGRLARMTAALLKYFNPNDLPEDASQQWQATEHECSRILESAADDSK